MLHYFVDQSVLYAWLTFDSCNFRAILVANLAVNLAKFLQLEVLRASYLGLIRVIGVLGTMSS